MIRIRWGAVSLLAAGALLVPAAGAHACLVDSSGMANTADPGSTNLNPGDSITVIGERLGSEAEPGTPVTFTAWITEQRRDDPLLTLAEKEPVPQNGRLARPFPIGDLGDRPRDLELHVRVEHPDGFELTPRPFTYLKPVAPPPAEQAATADPPPVETPSTMPLTPVPGDEQPQTPTNGSPSAPPPAGNGGTQSGPPAGPPPDPGEPGGHEAAQHATTVAHAHSHNARADGPPAIRVERAASAPKPSEPAAPAHATPARRTLTAPRSERADDPSRPPSLPGAVAAAPEQPVESDVPAVVVIALAGMGVALLLRRRPTGRAAIVPAPLPPRLPAQAAAERLTGDPPATKLPDPRELEAELQEMLAEHAAKTVHEGPRDGPLAGAR